MCIRDSVEPEDPQVQQNLAKSVAFVNQAAAATTFVDQELIEHQKTVEAYLTEEDCADSVSYTHLDVYKRQSPACRA